MLTAFQRIKIQNASQNHDPCLQILQSIATAVAAKATAIHPHTLSSTYVALYTQVKLGLA